MTSSNNSEPRVTEDAWQRSQAGRLARIVAVHAGLGTPSTSSMLAERLTVATRQALEEGSRLASVKTHGLRPLAVDIAGASIGGALSPALEEVVADLRDADGVILVSPVLQASYSGLFKSFIDVLPEGTLKGAPVLLGATGGTARHSLVTETALRPLVAHLGALAAPSAVFAASEDFGAAWEDTSSQTHRAEALANRIERAGKQLAQLVGQTSRQAPVDALSDFKPMGQLLSPGTGKGEQQS